jgi:hypothetical protein
MLRSLAVDRDLRPLEDRFIERAILALCLLLQLWLFSGSFQKFFCNDSLFYMVNAPHSWHEFVSALSQPDEAKQFRPLNLGLAALIKPYFGLNPHPYHWIPLIFHLINTVLFYQIARKLLSGSFSILFATGFWGFHSVAGLVTYDIAYLSDFFLAFLFLLSLTLALQARARKSRLLYAASLLAFVLSLLTKEVAITFPLGIWIGISLADMRKSGESGGLKSLLRALGRSLPFISIFWIIAILFTCCLLNWLDAGLIYAQGAGASYDFDPWSNLLSKTKYLYWALNLPDVLQIPHAQKYRLVSLGLMGGLLAIWLVDLLRRELRLSAIEWGGLIWFAGITAPALFLSHRLAKWYIYIPLFGLALILGVFAENIGNILLKIGRRNYTLWLLAPLLVPVLYSSTVQTRNYEATSDLAFQSDVIKMYLDEFRAANPVVPREAIVYLLPSFEKDAAKVIAAPPIDQDRLFKLFYPGNRIRALFAHKGDRLPENWRELPDSLILQWLNGRFYNVTEYYRKRRSAPGQRLIPLVDFNRITVSRDEYYPDYENFETPSGKAAFFPTPDKDILTQIAASTVVVPIGKILPKALLSFGVSWMFDQGDGGWAEMDLQTGEGKVTLYREYIQPNSKAQGIQWKEMSIDLQPYAQRDADLILKCYNDPGKKTSADWLNWRDIAITETK